MDVISGKLKAYMTVFSHYITILFHSKLSPELNNTTYCSNIFFNSITFTDLDFQDLTFHNGLFALVRTRCNDVTSERGNVS